ncbi:general secretion pathway protein GspK [Bradyrhizobium sp. BRP22]|uniref:general secretion pathway protein GspK n=1 Tax=Bradyrhizobium sp. BRP22 TaxID=2793821 RepID=UPI001CD36DD0|nr:type II secretion system protein GspK [Bradyrhizobium sp. BRP22]MCA1454592.1 general secretion pathway protein GspK [Bradyrhizobium sp. BRP22]
MTAIGARKCSAERGFVIVAVLWILAALASLAMVFAAYLSASTRAIAVNVTALQTEALVSASLELTAYQLALADESAKPPQGAFHFRMDDASVQVAFISEAARIDLNLAPKEMLAGLFTALGAGKDAAIEYADRVVGWRTRPVPGSANEEEARYNSAGYSPRQAPFTHVNELALVVGVPAALVERALPFVTVFNGSPDVDPAIAAREVIEAMPDKSANKQAPFGGSSVSLNAARPASPPSDSAKNDASTAKSPCYRVETTIRFRNGRRTTSEVVIAMGDKIEPYRVLSWQDDVAPRNAVSRRGST